MIRRVKPSLLSLSPVSLVPKKKSRHLMCLPSLYAAASGFAAWAAGPSPNPRRCRFPVGSRGFLCPHDGAAVASRGNERQTAPRAVAAFAAGPGTGRAGPRQTAASGRNARLLDTPSGQARRAGYFTSLGLSEDRYNQAVRELSDASLRQILLRHLQRDSLIGLWLWPRSRTPKDDAAQLERSRNRSLAQLKTPPPTVQSRLRRHAKTAGLALSSAGGPLVLLLPDHSVPIVAAAATGLVVFRSKTNRRRGP